MSEKIGEDQTYLLNYLMEKQFLYKLVLMSLRDSKLNQKELQKFEKRLQEKAFELTQIINKFTIKNNLSLIENLYIIDALYRTATWRMYEDWGHLADKILKNGEKREDLIGYL